MGKMKSKPKLIDKIRTVPVCVCVCTSSCRIVVHNIAQTK